MRRIAACRNHFDATVGQIADDATQRESLRLRRRRGAVIDSLDPTGDHVADRSGIAVTRVHGGQSRSVEGLLERSAIAARFFARTALKRAGP